VKIVHGAADESFDEDRGLYLLSELVDRPELLAPPRAIVPRLAYEGRITLLSAPRKSGKSTLVGAAAAALSRGGTFLSGPTATGTVLWAALDEPLGDLVRRLAVGHADGDNVFIAVPPCSTVELLSYAVPQPDFPRTSLVIIDAIGDLHAHEVDSENDSTQVRRALAPLRAFARRTGTAVIALHHTTKVTGRARGAGAYEEVADLVLTLRIPTDNPGTRQVEAEGRVGVDSFQFRLGPTGVELHTGEPTLFELVEAVIWGNPGCSTRAITAKVERRSEDVREALGKLNLSGRIVNRGSEQIHAWFCESTGYTPGDTPEIGRKPSGDAPGRAADTLSAAPRVSPRLGGLAGRETGGRVA
jgi:hypothetical protein